jgi:hypothetical protein
MKKKGHDPEDHNWCPLKSDNPFVEDASVIVVGDKVFIDTEKESICLTIDQAKKLTFFLHGRIIKPLIDIDDFGRNDYDE